MMSTTNGIQHRRSPTQALYAWVSTLRRTDRIVLVLTVVYVATLSFLTIREHNGFGTRALDLAKFDQAIWNTAHGRPFRTTLGEYSVIQSHFSPALALYAPLFWAWSDVRLLFIAQALLMAGAGLPIYLYLRKSHPGLGLTVFASYLMHPMIHQVNLIEFRRITLAVFATSLTILMMLRRRHRWMFVSLAIALLCKEDMAFTVVAVGLYIALAQRNFRLGIPLTIFGAAYLVLIPFIVLPALNAEASYRHAAHNFSYLGGSLSDIVPTLLAQPSLPLTYMFRPDRLWAVIRLFWPTLFLFVLAPEVAAFMLPNLGYLLASTGDAMGRLEDWYPGILLVYLYWAVALGARRLPESWVRIASGALILAGTAAWLSSSPLWPGAAFQPRNYTIVRHDRLVRRALRDVDPTAAVAAQDALVPHLSHREEIYLYPWIYEGTSVDTVALDRSMGTYPLTLGEYTSRFYDYLASTQWRIARQVDSFLLFERVAAITPEVARDDVWSGTVMLTGVSATLAADGTDFEVTHTDRGTATLRVALIWEMVATADRNYTVFVHVLDKQDQLLAQHDSWPADAHRPTSVLDAGTRIRDVHTLTWSGNGTEADALRIGVYDSLTGDPLTLSDGKPFVVVPMP
jgi:uncharacterized membrane protein